MIETVGAGHGGRGIWMGRVTAAIVALMLVSAGARPVQAQSCVADCDGDGTVAINEIISGVNILLGLAPLSQCSAADCNGNGVVSVNCLVQAVTATLEGCTPAVPTPEVEGPVTGGNGQASVAATSFDLSTVGYVQSEWFLSGTARAFSNDGAFGIDGKWSAIPAGTTAAYKTRVVVNRPIDPSDFNGTVYVEWLNVSGGLDAAPDFTGAHNEMIREGAAWVGLSAQKVGVEGGSAAVLVISLPLKKLDPVRYASLHHPGDSFSYDMFSQTGAAIRRRSGITALDELTIQRVIGIGESQSSFRLVTYINALHRAARVYDGFLVHSRGGIGAPLSEAPQASMPVPDTAYIRDDLDVPTLIFQTETDMTLLNYPPSRQPDTDQVRTWEVAGTAHADLYLLSIGGTDDGTSLDGGRVIVSSDPIPGILHCGEPVNSGPQHFVLDAAIKALDRWVRDGTPPPTSPRLEVNPGPPASIARDADGIALGGIRTPAVDVPIAVLSGDPQPGSLICSLFGSTVPFDAAKLASLYGDTATYVAAVEASTAAAVEAGFIVEADAPIINGAAAEVAIGE